MRCEGGLTERHYITQVLILSSYLCSSTLDTYTVVDPISVAIPKPFILICENLALAVLFFFTAVAHFGPMSAEVEKMLPRWVPRPKTTVFVTGLLEIMGAIGLIIPDTRRLAGICLIVFLVAVFPANVHAAKTNVKLAGRPVTRLWLRAPMQLLFIALLVWAIVA